MSTVLQFRPSPQPRPRVIAGMATQPCEIVIFPGVRIERHEVDLSHRFFDTVSGDDFDGKPRPRKTS